MVYLIFNYINLTNTKEYVMFNVGTLDLTTLKI